MITCPWCGTSYLDFQSNCSKCGGPLPAVETKTPSPSTSSGTIAEPPPAPRPISDQYVWRLFINDGWSIAALVFALLGVIFTLVGAGLIIGIITAFVGVPFFILGITFLGAAGGVLIWRYRQARMVVNVLQSGEATRGRIVEAYQNYSVEVNGRHPWVIRYQFQLNGQDHEGKVSTLNSIGENLQTGETVCILYLPESPQWNSIYPHP